MLFFSAVITSTSVLLNKFAVCKDLAGWLAGMGANCSHPPPPPPRHFWQPPRCLWKQTCHTLHTKQLLLRPAALRKAQTYSPEIFSVKVDQSWEDIAIHWAPDNEENIWRRLVVVNAWLHCPTCNWFAAHYKQLKTLRQHLYNLIDSTQAVSVFFLGFHLFGRSELLCLLYNQTCFLFFTVLVLLFFYASRPVENPVVVLRYRSSALNCEDRCISRSSSTSCAGTDGLPQIDGAERDNSKQNCHSDSRSLWDGVKGRKKISFVSQVSQRQ